MKHLNLWTRAAGCLPLVLACCISIQAHAAPATAPAKATIRAVSEKAFWWGDFAELERENAEFKQPGQFDEDGLSKLEEFRTGLNFVFDAKQKDPEPYLKELEALTLQWATEHPGSALAHTMYANALFAHAWNYRGFGFVKDVPPEAWRDFHAYLVRAFDYLKDHADVAFTDSYAQYTLLKIGRGLELPDREMAQVAQDGLKRNPQDISLYFTMMTQLLPKWGGDAKGLDRFIRESTEQTRPFLGTSMYARLYYAAADEQFGHELFQNSRADWGMMKQGFADMLARYPNSALWKNRYAYMACLAKDKATTSALLDQLGPKVDEKQWGPNPSRSLESCRIWAKQQANVQKTSPREGL